MPSPERASPSHYQVRLFRRPFQLPGKRARLEVHVSADSRYLLYCNGALVGRGPARGDVHHQFFDTYDLSSALRTGPNVLAAVVFDFSKVAHRPAALGSPCAIMTHAGGFVLEGEVETAAGLVERLDTGLLGWRVQVDRSYRFQNDGTRFEGYHGYFEHRVSRELPEGWTQPEFDERDWPAATTLYLAERRENRRDPTSPYGLVPRLIPPLEESTGDRFIEVFARGGGAAAPGWRELVLEDRPLVVSPQTTVHVVLDTGRLTTAYPELRTSGGAGARVRFTYAEALRLPWSTAGAKLLGRPQSLVNLASHFADESSGWTFDRRGHVMGWSDVWEPAGRSDETFEPWHWRAFRYIGVEISTAEEPLALRRVRHRFTAYPYRVEARFACSDPRLERIWRAALHTMRLCSHETFEDCPHYEQMQYAGDTMITSKLAMLTTGDYALSRQALYQFDWSRLPEGLTQSRYPSRLLQVIPSWSLHWITNLRDYAYCSGDLVTARELLPGTRAVLDWFRRHADGNGLPEKLPFWNITDWCPWWPRGVVPGADSGPTCIIAAQYIRALEDVADLARLVGDEANADRLAQESAQLRTVLHRQFWSEPDGLYLDRPGGPEVSQYGNAWAVVCGAAGAETRARLLKRFPGDLKLAPGSFFCWHTVFRALERCGAYDRMPEFLGPWHEMVDVGLDTFAEENSFWRSLCHAWSAHPALEFLTRVLGVTPAAPGFSRIEIRPYLCGLTHAEGRVCTPRGPVDVSWKTTGRRFSLKASVPAGTAVRLYLPDGSSCESPGGRIDREVVLK